MALDKSYSFFWKSFAGSLATMGLACLLSLSLEGSFGSRGEETIFKVNRDGEEILLKHNNIRFGPDRYYLLMKDGRKIENDSIDTEYDQRVSVFFGGYSIGNTGD